MRVTRDSKADVAKNVWTELLGYFFAHRDTTFGAVAELGLTPGDMKTLFEVDPDAGCSMSELANTLHCDVSNATWLVDRLEEHGFVERRPHPREPVGSRRSCSTPAGIAMKQRLVERLSEPPPDLLALDRAVLDQLDDALTQLAAAPCVLGTGDPAGGARAGRELKFRPRPRVGAGGYGERVAVVPSPTKSNRRAPASNGRAAPTSRCVPIPNRNPSSVSKASSSNPNSANHVRIVGVRSGSPRCRCPDDDRARSAQPREAARRCCGRRRR